MPSDTLKSGEWLFTGQSLFSKDGSVELKMQTDGKLCVYWGGKCRYQHTSQVRNDTKGVTMQEDGNLVIFSHGEDVLWASNTHDQYTSLVVQDDGNVVLYKPIWATETNKE